MSGKTVLRGLSIGSTDKFSHAILAHLFCPHFARDPPHSFGYASGLPPCSDEKIYANLTDFILSAIPIFNDEKNSQLFILFIESI
nr:hypothetical protein [uncultured Selenomonas sp.]